jgi:hypothetical protein
MEVLTEDNFSEIYKPQINHIERAKQPSFVADSDVCSWNGTMYETYGREEDYVKQIALENHKRIWTIVTCDDDENGDSVVSICAGLHHVNREGYLITEKPWETGAEYVEIVFELDN